MVFSYCRICIRCWRCNCTSSTRVLAWHCVLISWYMVCFYKSSYLGLFFRATAADRVFGITDRVGLYLVPVANDYVCVRFCGWPIILAGYTKHRCVFSYYLGWKFANSTSVAGIVHRYIMINAWSDWFRPSITSVLVAAWCSSLTAVVGCIQSYVTIIGHNCEQFVALLALWWNGVQIYRQADRRLVIVLPKLYCIAQNISWFAVCVVVQ